MQKGIDTMTDVTALAGASLAAIALATDSTPIAFANLDDVALASAMTAETAAMAKALNDVDTSVNGHGKAYGQRRAILQMVRKVDAGSLDAADKAAIGFDNLPGSARSKRQLSKWHSDFRLIAERWVAPITADDTFIALTEEQRNLILSGEGSFLSVADNVRKALAKAKADAAKADKAKETALAADKAKEEATPSAPMSLADMALALASALDNASDADREAAGEAMALLLDTVNAVYNVNIVEPDNAEMAIAA
jgi:hypothetical protein